MANVPYDAHAWYEEGERVKGWFGDVQVRAARVTHTPHVLPFFKRQVAIFAVASHFRLVGV